MNRRDIANWIVGLTDGEGSFVLEFQNFPAMKWGFQARPYFYIKLSKVDRAMLEKVHDFFGFGKIAEYKSTNPKHSDQAVYEISNLRDSLKIMDFFRKHPLQSKKRIDFKLWSECLHIVATKKHLTKDGLLQIARIREDMNLNKKNRYVNNLDFVRGIVDKREGELWKKEEMKKMRIEKAS